MPYSIGRGKHTCTKLIGVGEVAMHENADGSYRTVIGDGRTPLNELPTFSGEPRGTLRDTFAAAALTGLLAGPAAGPDQTFQEFAAEAFLLADAMLRERDKTSAEKTSGSGSVTLTDEEREALESEVELAEYQRRHEAPILRGLLERTGGER